MPILGGRKKQWVSLALPVSYRLNETRERLFDARNVYPNQGRLSTRFGVRRYNSTSLAGEILSASFFKDTSNNRKLLAKVGTVIYSVAASGAHTSIKTGLTSTTKHRGVTFDNRHIIAVENDGLFQWDGTTFTQLGQAAPSAPTIATQGTGLTNSTYVAVYTFYSSTTGFESNQSADSNSQATVSQGLRVTMATTAANGTIDKKRIYLKDVTANGAYKFVAEVDLGTATYDITSNPTSTTTPPTTHAAPVSGGGKFIVKFGRCLAYAGNNTYKNDVYISEEDLPDAFDDTATSKTFAVTGNGPITGLATGFFDDSAQTPYLVAFKQNSITVYSDLNGVVSVSQVDDKIGCVNHETIIMRNGDIYFLSASGWRWISNGRLMKGSDKKAITLGDGDVDDIFKSPGYTYELNAGQWSSFHGVYFSQQDQYLTFVAEGSSTSFTKAYCYSFEVQGFYPWEFVTSFKTSVNGEDSSGNETLFFGDTSGYFFTYSGENAKTDNDSSATDSNIVATAYLAWFQSDFDMSRSHSFVELFVKALSNSNAISVYTWLNFALGSQTNYSFTFPAPTSGFILDVSALDEGVFSDGREIVTSKKHIKRTGKNILIGFYQSAADSSLELISTQLEYVSNGNNN